MKAFLILFFILVIKVYAEDCWSEPLGYPCCTNTKVENFVYIDNNGKWGVENNKWCGIIEKKTTIFTPTPKPKTITTTTNSCGRIHFTVDPMCTKKGGVLTKIIGHDGCPHPACYIRECWSESLGFPCCSNTNEEDFVYLDYNGKWGIENNEWCGIIEKDSPAFTPTPTSTSSTMTTTKSCGRVMFTPNPMCSKKGGIFTTSIGYDGCPYPTCYIKECWSESLGYPCCSVSNDNVVYTDNNGEWGVESNKWCGILREKGYNTCSSSTFTDSEICTKNGGTISLKTVNGCPSPVCNTDKSCWASKLGYPCCTNTDNVISTDENGQWGIENNGWCGILHH